MVTKSEIINQAYALGFDDIGFTTAEPFQSQIEVLNSRQEMYAWTAAEGLDLISGVDPKNIHAQAKSIIVLIKNYFSQAFPRSMENKFGRCYLDDDRVTKDGLSRQIKSFRNFLRDDGIDSKVPFNMPHRLAAARAGLGTFGKNCLLYSRSAARQGSWVLPVALVVDYEFEPDEPTMYVDCPEWCRNACLAACPTKALMGACKIDPRKCISYLSYYGEGITPLDLREPMGMWVYGCDRCQNVCPRNQPWLTAELPENEKVAGISENFELTKLLHMDLEYFKNKVQPYMFYISAENIGLWQMNVARVMGNSNDSSYVSELIKAFNENPDERVKGMSAWALGRLGGTKAKKALEGFRKGNEGLVQKEVELARERFL